MSRRVPIFALLVAILCSSLLSVGAAAHATDPLPLPDTMAAVGDSISQAASTGGSLGADYPQNSWSTGTNTSVNSHYLRLLALGAPISGRNYNRSVSGAKAAGLNAQMQNVIAFQPDYLTVQIGGNDVCTDTVAQMTSVADFRSQFLAAMTTLTTGSPATHVYLTSIPDAYQLWSLFKDNGWARFIWSIGGVCQSLLANPTSTQQADVDRRAAVRQRNIDFNTQLRDVCALFDHCRWDANAVFMTQFTTSDVAGDYFHPSTAGQAKLAAGTWAAGYAWATTPPPNTAPTASFTHSCLELTCTFTDTSTDSDGTITSRGWAFGDNGTAISSPVEHTFAAAGTYTVSLTVTDDDGATAVAGASVAVSVTPPPEPMWVGALSGVSATSGRNGWTATVTVTVRDAFGPVDGVAVTGTWSNGSTGSCTTGTSGTAGTCTVKSPSLSKKNVPSVTFTVTGLAKSGWAYVAPVPPPSTTVLKP